MNQGVPDPEYLPKRPMHERIAHGQALRHETPHERHAGWRPPDGRAAPLEILQWQAAERIPELAPIRYGRMAASPFAFFRGGAGIMAADLAGTATCGLRAQLCGDAHCLNFGIFETPERSLVFGLNDFDETLPGPIEWDVKRLATSMEIAGRDLGFSSKERERAVLNTVRAYREAMLEFADMRNIDLWHVRLSVDELRERLGGKKDRPTDRAVESSIRKGMRRDHLAAFGKLVEQVDGRLRFRSDPPKLERIEDLLTPDQRPRYVEVMTSFLQQYRASLYPHVRGLMETYRFVHIARKVVGVGSIGTRDWAVLFTGRNEEDPLLLQLKEAQPSVLAPFAGTTTCESEGCRVVEGQRYMQTASDPLLGWYRLEDLDGRWHDYYVRQLWDGKSSIDITKLNPTGFRAYGRSCGWTLARGHARSGDRIAMANFLGEDDSFERVMVDFATAYADVTEADYSSLLEAIDQGKIEAVFEV